MDHVLQIIREHPEGITTPEIAEIVYPDTNLPRNCVLSKVSTKCRNLARYGLIEGRIEPRINCSGRRAYMNVWAPAA